MFQHSDWIRSDLFCWQKLEPCFFCYIKIILSWIFKERERKEKFEEAIRQKEQKKLEMAQK
jgi:hypothetical protein